MVSPWDSYKSHWLSLVLMVFTTLLVEGGPVPLGAPQLRQRQNLAHGICNRPLAISVCLESCMAENAREFGQMGLFASNLIKYFTNVQSNTIKMAINYCSSIQQWVNWTPAAKVFADYVMGMNQLYTFSMNNAFGAYGPFGTYGAYSPLQPAAGVCLEKARLSMAQLPPSYQKLVILFTSGRSSNPVYTIQQAQALMLGGAEIFAVTERELEMSEELKLSVSGPSYLMAVNDMNSLGRPEIDAIIMNVCKIERSIKSPLFPINVVFDLQKPNEHFHLPPLLAQQDENMTATTTSSFNTSTTGANITSSDSGFSGSETPGLHSSSTEASPGNNSSSFEAGAKDLQRQHVSTSEPVHIWQNVTEIPQALPINQSSFDTLRTEALAMQSASPFGTTQSGISGTVSSAKAQSVSSVPDSTTFGSFHSEAASADFLESNSTQTVTSRSEKTSFTISQYESTLFSSSEPNSTLEYETTITDSLESQNTTLRTLASGKHVTGTLESENTTFGLLPLIDASGENLLKETTQSVIFSTQNIPSEIFKDSNRLPKKSPGVSEINETFSNISSTATVPLDTSDTDNPALASSLGTRSTDSPSSQISTTDNFQFEAKHLVTLPSQTFLHISSTVNTTHDLFQAGVLPSNNFPPRNNLGNMIQSDGSFSERPLSTNKWSNDSSNKQNETDAELPLEFMTQECAELEGITDPVMRSKIMQERPACNNSERTPHNTPEMPCIDLSNTASPLVRLDMLMANIPRQPCPDNTTKNSFASTASPEVAPQTNISDNAPERPRIVSPDTQDTRICIDLSNIFDIYRLGVLLANWPNQSVGENNISKSLKPAHADSISALGVVHQDKHQSLKQLLISDQPQSQQLLHTAETLDTSSTLVMFTPTSLATVTTDVTTTTDSSAEAIKELAINKSMSSDSSSMLSMTALSTTDSIEDVLTMPAQPCINISIFDNPLIGKALLSVNNTLRPCTESDITTPITNSGPLHNNERFSRELDSNNFKHNSTTTSLRPESMSTDPTNIIGATSSLETPTITSKQPLNTGTFSKDNLKATNLSCIDISSAPINTRRVVVELIKPLIACPIDSGLAEISFNASFPEIISSSTESESQNSCLDLAMLPPYIRLIVNIFPVLNPCKTHNHVKVTKRDIAFNTRTNTPPSLSQPFGNVGTVNKPPIDEQRAVTSEVPCVDISILPENDRPLAADFLRLYNILSCDSQKSAHSISDQTVRSDSCVNVTMFSGKERTAIAIYFSVYGIPPCSETQNCLEFTLLPPELLNKYMELYGPVTLCNTKAPTAFTDVLGGESTISPTSATTNEVCRDPSIVGELGLTASPSNCHSFVICSGRTPGRNWTQHDLIPCPPQLFWSQERLSCVSPGESSCVTELCSDQSKQLKMASVIFPECPEYLHCNSGKITRHCCPEGHIFRDGTCQEGINIGCPSSCDNVTQRL